VTIGNDTVVGPGAVVTRDLPGGVVAVGTPAQILREIGDSESVSVAGEVAAGVTDLLVVNEACGEREQSERDAGAEAFDRAAAVGFEGEWLLQVQNTDSIHWRTAPSDPCRRGSSLC
jgi:hypothetical protein